MLPLDSITSITHVSVSDIVRADKFNNLYREYRQLILLRVFVLKSGSHKQYYTSSLTNL